MSRKHFEEIARVLSTIADDNERRRVAREMASALASTNPNFNRSRFLGACNAD